MPGQPEYAGVYREQREGGPGASCSGRCSPSLPPRWGLSARPGDRPGALIAVRRAAQYTVARITAASRAVGNSWTSHRRSPFPRNMLDSVVRASPRDVDGPSAPFVPRCSRELRAYVRGRYLRMRARAGRINPRFPRRQPIARARTHKRARGYTGNAGGGRCLRCRCCCDPLAIRPRGR